MTSLENLKNRALSSRLARAIAQYPVSAIMLGSAMLFPVCKMFWDYLEPYTGALGFAAASVGGIVYGVRLLRVFASDASGDFIIAAVGVNADIAQAVTDQFGRVPDVYVDAFVEFHTRTLKPDQMRELAIRLAKKCALYRNRRIKLILSGPPSIAFQCGQLLGAHKFGVAPLYYTKDETGKGIYQEVMPVGLEEIGAMDVNVTTT